MNVTCLQFDIVWEEKAPNHEKVSELLEAAAPREETLVLLPEMFATGFSMNVAGIADDLSRETQDFLSQTAARYRIYLAGGIVTRGEDGRGRNECVVFAPDGGECARYAKMHPFTAGGELGHYAKGEAPQLFNWGDFVVAPFICYDLRFPEVFRSAARRGANLFAVIANWPALREHHWVTLLQARAIENQAYVAAVNRCGTDPHYTYSGRSLIIDPHGQILIEAGEGESAIGADLDLAALLDWRHKFPALTDMHDEYVR